MEVLDVTPFLYVPDLEQALALFDGVLGFKLLYREANYAYLRRDKASLRLLGAEVKRVTEPCDRRFACYIDVRDVDTLYAEFQPKAAHLPAGTVCPPHDTEYGQRELHVIGPDGNSIVFGQPTKQP